MLGTCGPGVYGTPRVAETMDRTILVPLVPVFQGWNHKVLMRVVGGEDLIYLSQTTCVSWLPEVKVQRLLSIVEFGLSVYSV